MGNTLKVAQVIDSLRPGGAEMVAVNIANELSKRDDIQSYIIITRMTGLLEKRLLPGVKVFFFK